MNDIDIDALIERSLAGDEDDDAAWSAIRKLHHFGTKAVLDKAIDLTRFGTPARRGRGADILAQLGIQPGIASTAFIAERFDALMSLLRSEEEPAVLRSTIIALGHLGERDGILAILPFSKHANEDVRYAVAWVLPGGVRGEQAIIDTLLLLMNDSDSDVRDWATFSLGTQSDDDSDTIRDGLYERIHDEDYDTRSEAAVGLAKRKDLRVLPEILEELNKEEYGTLFEEAAAYLLDLDGRGPKEWESWQYIEALRSHFNIVEPSSKSPHA